MLDAPALVASRVAALIRCKHREKIPQGLVGDNCIGGNEEFLDLTRGEFISEPITPLGGFDAHAMSKGEPGLPAGFKWRSERFEVIERKKSWKQSEREKGRADGEMYLRRHCYLLQMSDGNEWTVYFTRQPARGGSPKRRWYLYSMEKSL